MSAYFVRFVRMSLAICCAFGGLPATAQSLPLANHTSYIGVGSAIGVSGNTTALGTGGVVVLTKVGFSEHLSLHDATILFGSGTPTSMIILTAELPIRNDAGKTMLSPFLGGGAMVRYRDGVSFSPAISGGVDIPLSKDFTGTVRLNVGFPRNQNADIGVLIGAGYNLGG
jgi:hypothetical protein